MPIKISFLNNLRNSYNNQKDWFKRTFKRYELNAGHFSDFINSLGNPSSDRELTTAETLRLLNIFLTATSVTSPTNVSLYSPEGTLFDDLKKEFGRLYESGFGGSITYEFEALKEANLLTENNFTAYVSGPNRNWAYRLSNRGPNKARMLTQANFDAIVKFNAAGIKLLWILEAAGVLDSRFAALCEINNTLQAFPLLDVLENAAESGALTLATFDIINQNKLYAAQVGNLSGYYHLVKQGYRLECSREKPINSRYAINPLYLYTEANQVFYCIKMPLGQEVVRNISLELGDDFAPIKAVLGKFPFVLDTAQKEKIRSIAANHREYLANGLNTELFNLIFIKIPLVVKEELSKWLIEKANDKLIQSVKEKGFRALPYEESTKPQQAIDARVLEELLKLYHPDIFDFNDEHKKNKCLQFIHEITSLIELDEVFFAKVTAGIKAKQEATIAGRLRSFLGKSSSSVPTLPVRPAPSLVDKEEGVTFRMP